MVAAHRIRFLRAPDGRQPYMGDDSRVPVGRSANAKLRLRDLSLRSLRRVERGRGGWYSRAKARRLRDELLQMLSEDDGRRRLGFEVSSGQAGIPFAPASRCQKALSTQNVLQPVKAGSGVERLQSENVAPISMAVPSDDWRGSEIDTQHDPGSPGGILLRLVRLII